MSGKSLNVNGKGSQASATLSPGDFPLGSMLSRAAARSMLANNGMPQDDRDALDLFCGVGLLNARMDPSYAELERTAAYARGKQLREESDTPNYFESGSSSAASSAFRMGFGRNPENGDLMRYTDVKAARHPVWHVGQVKQFIAAWSRQILGLPCPFRVEEDNRVFRRLGPTATKDNNGQQWEEDLEHLHHADSLWRLIEREAKGRVGDLEDAGRTPTIAGVTYAGSTWRPATERELREVEIEPSGGLLGLLAKAASRIEKEREVSATTGVI